MQVKKSIKKVGAVAGSALMVGMTFGAAAPLADFPQPFVDDDGQVQSQIVVGSQGKVADVVGAINIGASVGQAAVQTTEETVEGGSSVEVDGHADETEIRGQLNEGDSVLLGSYDYSPLVFDTEWGENDHLVEEEVRVNRDTDDSDGNDDFVSTTTNGTEVITEVDAGAIEYSVDYAPGFGEDDQIVILGEEYTITSLDTSENGEVELGSKMEETGLELGDSYEHGPYTVTVVDKDSSADGGAIYVEVARDGQVLQAKGLSTNDDDPIEVDDGDFTVEADDVFFGSQRDYIDVTSVYTDTTIEGGEDSPFDEDYTAHLSFDTDNDLLEGVTLTNNLEAVESPTEDDDSQIEALSEGDEFAGPADYFTVSYAQLQDPDTESLTFSDDRTVRYTDGIGNTNTVDFTALEEGDGGDGSGVSDEAVTGVDRKGVNYPVEVSHNVSGEGDASVVEVSLSYGDHERSEHLTIDGDQNSDDVSGLKLGPLTVTVEGDDTSADDGANIDTINVYNGDAVDAEEITAATLHTSFEGEITRSDDDTAVLTEGNDDTITVNYETGADAFSVDVDGTDAVAFSSDASNLDGEGEELSSFGSLVAMNDDENEVSVTYPESQVHADLTVGDSETTTTSGGTYNAIDADAQGDLPSMAMLDSDVQESHKANNHLILVGGPAVNTLVSDLVDEGDVDLSELEGQGSGALIQGVNDAFSDGQHALVVAGVEADDTRSAAQYISNYASHESALDDAGDRMVLAEADYPSEQ